MADAGQLSHEDAEGATVLDRVEDTGFPLEGDWRTTENIGYASTEGNLDAGEIDRLHDGLMESDSHRANVLDPDVSFVGIGLSVGRIDVGGESREAVFVTQNFAETDGEVLVQEEVDSETVVQPYRDGEPLGEPELVDMLPPEESPQAPQEEDEEDETSGGSGGGCFIATAAYGDRTHPDVASLRRFRDEVLVGRGVGRAFIRAYAILGPLLARLVAHDRASGRAARALIAPMARLAARSSQGSARGTSTDRP